MAKPQNPHGGFPLTAKTVLHYSLLGDQITTNAGFHKKISNPKNGFTKIRAGGTDRHPYFGIMFDDIIRYWREVQKMENAEEFINNIIDKKDAEG